MATKSSTKTKRADTTKKTTSKKKASPKKATAPKVPAGLETRTQIKQFQFFLMLF